LEALLFFGPTREAYRVELPDSSDSGRAIAGKASEARTALLYHGHRLQRMPLIALRERTLEHLVEHQGWNQQFLRPLDRPSEERGVRTICEMGLST
jgi:hypothetical protein